MTISSLDLKDLVFTETPTALGVYSHAATANQTVSYSLKDSRIAISFGQTGANAPAPALQWLDPATGNITAGESAVSSKQLAGRMDQSLVQVGNNLWSSGGRPLPATGGASATVPVIADTPTYDLSSKTWSNLTKGLARYGHASARVGRDKVVSCFGVDTGRRQGAECVYFSVSSAKYEDVKLIWANPEDRIKGSRIGHTLVTGLPDAYTLYLFGGQNPGGTTFFQDFYRLDASKLPTITITKIHSTEATFIPSPRSGHAALTVGSHQGFMVIHGGIGSNNTMADAAPYFFDMTSGSWIDGAAFQAEYADQKIVSVSSVSVWIIIAAIMAGVTALGACVALYIWKGLRDDERERERQQQEEAAKQQTGSPTLSTMEDSFDDGRQGGGEGKSHQAYNLGSGEDHSMSMGPFKSTSLLIQPDGDESKAPKKKIDGKSQQRSSESYNASPTTYRSRNNEPYSPGGTTLTENGSVNGYFSSSSSSPSRLNKNNSNASSHHSRQGTAATVGSVTRPPAAAIAGNVGGRGGPGRDPYYNTRDMYLDDHEDDDSSMTVSVTSEGSNLSPWAGPVRLENDFAPPNPRFSRGAISHAHRQLVGSIITNNAAVAAAGGNRSSSGWDTSSPGGSLSSRDDSEHQRRSVNSM
ncbi:hypothetical protein BG011_007356, partial [Mortierella polycephala]